MLQEIFKSKGVKIIEKYFFETLILVVFAIATLGYVIFLKSNTEQTVFVRASIQKPDWWQNNSQIPSDLLSSIKTGDSDPQHTLKVVELKYFLSEAASWEVNSPDRNIGRIQFEIKTNKQGGKFYYNGQELYVGNPLVVIIGNNRLELLVTNISDKKIEDNYVKRKILVRVYDKYPEQIDIIKPGVVFKDNEGFPYASVLSVEKEHTRIITADQQGNPHAQRNPWKYDLNILIETLAKQDNSRILGYDGRAIALGRKFIFGITEIDDVGGYIQAIY